MKEENSHQSSSLFLIPISFPRLCVNRFVVDLVPW
jgi:hypothetical protein